MSIRAVLFDMGGTIETFHSTPELRAQATPELGRRLRAAGIDLHLGDEQLCALVVSGWNRYHEWSITTLDELPAERVWGEYIFGGLPVDPLRLAGMAQELMVHLETHFYQRALRPEVPAVLAAIKKMGLKIGLISNVCSRDQVPASLKSYHIHHYFDPIVLSSEYGRRKPDPAIFHYAARLANVPTSACLYIGDRIARDILGARRAGYALAVQIINPYDHGEKDNGAVPDAVIHDMGELLPILETHAAQAAPRPAAEGIRALIFDAGDILYHRPNRGREFREFLTGLGLAERVIPPAAKQELKQQSYHGAITQDQSRLALLDLYGITDPALIEQGKCALEADDNSVEIFAGVPETLKTLKQHGYLLAIITDTANPLHVKLSWFERDGFGHVWDSIISSQELGVQKPDPAIYTAALQHLGLEAKQAVFVGHSPEELDGAHQVGMPTVAFNYGETARADFYIKEFSGLLDLPGISANHGKKRAQVRE